MAVAVLLVGLKISMVESQAGYGPSNPAPTSVKLTSSPNPSNYGQNVVLTVSVTPSAATGTITFLDGTTTIGTATLAKGAATFTAQPFTPGSHTLTASYGGDTSDQMSVSAAVTQVVNLTPDKITMTSSANPATFGQAVTLTVKITPTTATGDLTFKDGDTVLGTSSLGAGSATMPLNNLALGSHTITVSYPGDSTDAGATATVTEVVKQATSATVLTSSVNPSGLGQPIALTATVTPAAATGSITFMDGTATLGSSSLTGGVATLAVSTLAIGKHTLTAVYAGDTADLKSTSTALTQTVSPAAATTTLNSSANPATVGQSVTLTATVSPATATGSVTFMDGTATLGTGTLSSGSATQTVTTLALGSHALTAVYGGDTNNGKSTSAVLTEAVNPATTTTTLSSSANPATFGQSVTLTAAVSPATATGTVTFKDGATTLGTGKVSSGSATLAVTTLTAGTHSLTAVYAGDAGDAGSTSAALTETVNGAATTTTLTSSANPSTPGQSVTLTATVSPATATGTVTFKDGANTLGNANLNGGIATLAVTTFANGSHSLTAVYGGDAADAGGTSTALTQTVAQVTTTVTLTSSANPATSGQSVTLTATVSPATATGTVTFKDGATTLGNGNLNGGIATLAVTTLANASHSLTAVYGGDAGNAGSTSAALTQTIAQATTTVTLTSSVNPAIPGQSVNLTATVSPATASGVVTFKDGATTLGSGNLNSGIAALTVTTLAIGSHSLTAVYGGDAGDAGNTSAALTETIAQAAITITLTSSANPSTPGQNVTLTATVSPATATGAVTFKDGANALGSGNLNAGVATFSVATLATGSHSITAVYGGDSGDAGSTSTALAQTVGQTTTTVTLTSSANPATVGQSVAFTATVSPTTATGTITFQDGASTLGTGSLSGGAVTLAGSTLRIGSHSLTAVYGGDGNDAASTSAVLSQTVGLPPTTITLTSSPNPSLSLQTVTLTATVSPAGATGTVTFNDAGGAMWSGIVNLSGGIATLTTTGLWPGTHTLTAVYSGDANYANGTSAALTHVANGLIPASACAPNFNYTIGQAVPDPLVCQYLASATAPYTVTTTASWLQVTPASGQLGTTVSAVSISVNPTGLAAGQYTGYFTIGGPQLGSLTVNVPLTVIAGQPPARNPWFSPAGLEFVYQQGDPVPPSQGLSVVTGDTSQLPFTVDTGGASWLKTVASGTSPQTLDVAVDPTGLAAGYYQTTLTVYWPGGNATNGGGTPAPVYLTVNAPAAPQLSVSATPIVLMGLAGGSPAITLIQVVNFGGGALNYSASTSGGGWLSVTSASGTVDATISNLPGPLLASCDPSSLAPGIYQGSVTVTADTTVTIPVTCSVFTPQPLIAVSHSGLSFTAATGGGAPQPQMFSVHNAGSGLLNWTSTVTTLAGGNWLQLSTNGGVVQLPLDQTLVVATIDPGIVSTLAEGEYYGQIQIAGPGANSPQVITVRLTVTSIPGMVAGPELSTSTLVFTGQAGVSPNPSIVMISDSNPAGNSFISGQVGSGFTYSPSSGTLAPNQALRLQVTPDFSTAVPGEVDHGTITLQFSDGSVRTISVMNLVAPSAQPPGSCANLNVVWNAPSPAGNMAPRPITQDHPIALQVQVVDNCGNLFIPAYGQNAIVQANFADGDPPLNMTHLGNGVWVGFWESLRGPEGGPSIPAVTVMAVNADPATGSVLQSGQSIPSNFLLGPTGGEPVVTSGGVQHSGTILFGQRNPYMTILPVSPGSLIMLEGWSLTDGCPTATIPFVNQLNGSQVFLGAEAMPITLSCGDPSGVSEWSQQVNVQVPYDAPVNTVMAVTIQRDNMLSIPVQLAIAVAQPAIYTMDGSWNWLGQIVKADGTQPTAGDVVTIYCTGLGAVTPAIPTGTPPSAGQVYTTVNPVSVTIGGQDAQAAFGTLVPGQPGTYQVNAIVPAGVSGNAVLVVMTVAGQMSQAVFMSVQ